jgi:hypothetical protein
MVRAGALGFFVLAVAAGVWVIAMWFRVVPEPLMTVMFLAPGLAALVASWKAPRGKFLVGLFQAPIWALLWVILKTAMDVTAGAAGDFPGGRGASWLFTLMLLGALIPAVVGAAGGVWLTRLRRARSRMPGPG